MLKDKAKPEYAGTIKPIDLICDYCGEEYTLSAHRNRKKSHKILAKDACKKCRMKKKEESSLIKYGKKNAAQTNDARKKSSKSKGGTGNIVSDYKDQILDLYNNNENISVVEIAKKLNLGRTTLRTYMENELKLDVTGDWRSKLKRAVKEKYGVDHASQSEEIQNKIKETNKEKYGYENPYDNKDYKDKYLEKSGKTNLERYGFKRIVQDPNRQEEFQEKRRKTRIANNHEVEYNGQTAKELAKNLGLSLSSFHERVRKVGLEKAISTDKHTSYLEAIFIKFLEENNIKFKAEFKIENRIADFYLTDHNLLIEADGLYWHSDAIERIANNYHSNKRQLYIDNGYLPLFFRENEINNQFEIVKSIILNKMGEGKKIGARKCVFQEAPKKEAKIFFNENHLMGNGQGKTYGLYYDNQLVCGLQLKRVKQNHYEVSRFCSLLNHNIVGGFSKLLKQMERDVDMDSLQTFIDLRYGQGSYLPSLGFTYKHSYLSFKWTNGVQVFNRMKFPGNSGYDRGLVKIWDCGQAKYIKSY